MNTTPDSQPLLRQEALAAGENGFGRPVTLPLRAARLTSLAIAAMLLLVVAALLFVWFPKIESAEGYLLPSGGFTRVVAPRDGIVTEVRVTEGTEVRAGAGIANVRMDTHSSQGTAALGIRLEDSEKAVDLARLRTSAVQSTHQIRMAQNAADRLDLERQSVLLEETIRIHAERLDRMKSTLADQERLQKEGFVAAGALRETELRVLEMAQALNEKKRERQSLVARLEGLSVERQRLAATNEVELAQARESQLGAESRRNETRLGGEYALVASVDGAVTNVAMSVGDPVSTGQLVAAIVPAGVPLIAEAWVTSAVASRIRPGTRVNVKINAFPYQTFGIIKGVIRSVGAVPATPNDLPFNFKLNEPKIRVRIGLDRQTMSHGGEVVRLPAGALMSADFIVEDRRLLDWMLAPLRASPMDVRPAALATPAS
ncbi:HlyD family secretion protein [Roseateles depolymerans]|uniref:Uncharacterized protein n=1 Tax=Roseateles depolymerans TaxID=76731 RepID=A0A0U3N0P0_9BURK|nr:HlyD family efflux transporter periplasmic adaptor subunit [Roseateles depolymerans]ALV07748.1 hypothetical protein RD2015_3290 [Roseateles depolymerans]REG22031.1 multidrug resistance efflux pump [Roseateles depolymerans]